MKKWKLSLLTIFATTVISAQTAKYSLFSNVGSKSATCESLLKNVRTVNSFEEVSLLIFNNAASTVTDKTRIRL